ncbi:MAG: Trp family transcriptional regulator [Lentisphaeria bacterium]
MIDDYFEEFVNAFTSIQSKDEMREFLLEICTPREIHDMSLRWRLMEELYNGVTHRKIASEHKISLCKITRGSKYLKNKNTVSYRLLKEKYGERDNDKEN